MLNSSSCPDCEPYEKDHLQNWIGEFIEILFNAPFELFMPNTTYSLDKAVDDVLLKLKFFSLERNINLDRIHPLTAVFIRTARKFGFEFYALKSFRGYTGYFRMKIGDRLFDFEELPRAENSTKNKWADKIDDKGFVKRVLQKNGLPVAPGRNFWWFQKDKAANWANNLGYPLIVKPRKGSLSKHVYYDIKNEAELKNALNKVVRYSPTFLIEKFLPELTLYRITVIDGKNIFAAKRLPPKIIGDGKRTISELAEKSNIPENNINIQLLNYQGLDLNSVPPKNETVLLHKKITVALGAKIEEVNKIHPDNAALAKKVAEIFGSKLIGIDFLGEDIKKSWKSQRCAILELNSLPNIVMHNFQDKNGRPRNKVAEALVQMTLKYYS